MEYFSNNLAFLRKKAGKKQHELSLDLGFTSASRYSNYETGHSKPDLDTLILLANHFKVTIDDLLNTDMSDTSSRKVNEASTPYSKGKSSGIPLIPVDAIAGLGNGDIQVLYRDADRYIIPEFNKKADFLIRISGTSMNPKYFNGDIVACKKVTLKSFIQWGKVYVMDTEQGAICKRIYPGKDPKTVQVVSDNKEIYPPFDMPVSAIRSLAIVVGVIRLE